MNKSARDPYSDFGKAACKLARQGCSVTLDPSPGTGEYLVTIKAAPFGVEWLGASDHPSKAMDLALIQYLVDTDQVPKPQEPLTPSPDTEA